MKLILLIRFLAIHKRKIKYSKSYIGEHLCIQIKFLDLFFDICDFCKLFKFSFKNSYYNV